MDPALLALGQDIGKDLLKDALPQLAATLRPDEELSRTWNELLESLLLELARRVDNVEEGLGDLIQRVAKRTSDREERRIVANYLLEMTREPLDERYRLLASAAAESLLSSLSKEERARVERVLRELDPRDVVALHRLGSGTTPDEADELVASGCVIQRAETWGGATRTRVEISARGNLVLVLTQPWFERQAPAE